MVSATRRSWWTLAVVAAILVLGPAKSASNDLFFVTGPFNTVFFGEVMFKVPSGPAGDYNGDGTTDQFADEYVEVRNFAAPGALAIDISGWQVREESDENPFTFPVGTIVGPGQTVRVFGVKSPDAPPNFSAGGRIGDGFSNGGDTAFLYNNAGTLIDYVIDPGTTPGQSAGRTSPPAEGDPNNGPPPVRQEPSPEGEVPMPEAPCVLGAPTYTITTDALISPLVNGGPGDLDADTFNVGAVASDSTTDLAEWSYTTQGLFVPVNNDDDNKNGIADHLDTTATTTGMDPEDDLRLVRLNVGDGGYVQLQIQQDAFSNVVNLWVPSSRFPDCYLTNATKTINGIVYRKWDTTPEVVPCRVLNNIILDCYLEGVTTSQEASIPNLPASTGSLQLRTLFRAGTAGTYRIDRIAFTVVGVNAIADSDNNSEDPTFAPDLTEAEDAAELSDDDALPPADPARTDPGAIFFVDHDGAAHFTPVQLEIPAPIVLEKARVRLAYDPAKIKVWTTDKPKSDEDDLVEAPPHAAAPGQYLAPYAEAPLGPWAPTPTDQPWNTWGVVPSYTADQLDYCAQRRSVTLYVQALAQSVNLGDISLVFELDPDGPNDTTHPTTNGRRCGFTVRDRIRATAQLMIFEAVTFDPETGEEEPAQSVVTSSLPRPEVELESVGATLLPNGQVQISVAGVVTDRLSELIDAPGSRLQEVYIEVNGTRYATKTLTPPVGPGVLPWQRVVFEAPFSETFTVPGAPDYESLVVRAITDENAAGTAGWDEAVVVIQWQEIAQTVPLVTGGADGLTLAFAAAPTAPTADSVTAYFGNRAPLPADPELDESSTLPAGLLFAGTVRSTAAIPEDVPTTVTLMRESASGAQPTWSAGVADEFTARVIYLPPGETDNVALTAHYVETGNNTLVFRPGSGSTLTGSFVVGAVEPSITANFVPQIERVEHLEGSAPQTFEPYLIRAQYEGPLSEDELKLKIDDEEKELLPFTYSPERYFWVDNPSQLGASTKIATDEVLDGALNEQLKNGFVQPSVSGGKRVIQWAIGDRVVGKRTYSTYQQDYEVPPTSSWLGIVPGVEISFDQLLTYYRLVYGNEGLLFYEVYQENAPPQSPSVLNNISLTTEVSKFDVKVHRNGLGQAVAFTVQINPNTETLTAATYMYQGLRKAVLHPEFPSGFVTGDTRIDIFKAKARSDAFLESANNSLAAIKVSIEIGVSIVSEAADWVITINAIAEGDYAAAIALLPVVSYAMVSTGKASIRLSCGAGGLPRRKANPCDLLAQYTQGACDAVNKALKLGKFDIAGQYGLLKPHNLSYRDLLALQSNTKLLQSKKDPRGLKNALNLTCGPPIQSLNPGTWVVHHRLPFEMAQRLALIGIDVNKPEWGIWVRANPGDVHPSGAHIDYNTEWRVWWDGQFRDKNIVPTRQQVEAKLLKLESISRFAWQRPTTPCP